ncbi:MAG TPA: hypothetical protein VNA20_15170 [Frankiaceae bacterium]|nr:hypothetical protein [Frankiaceae bacterium]
MTRKLSLRREALQELTTAELVAVAGGATKQSNDWSCGSCMTYVSCYITDCIGDTLNDCIVTLDTCS